MPREVPHGSPCRRHQCSACCCDTQMSLTLADVRRLDRAGRVDYCFEDKDGYLRLHNVDGHCVFLVGESCSVYAHRPEGCVLYPLIFLEGGADEPDADEPDAAERTGLHDFCPYADEFSFGEGDRAWLCRSIAREEKEAAERRRRRSGSDGEDPLP